MAVSFSQTFCCSVKSCPFGPWEHFCWFDLVGAVLLSLLLLDKPEMSDTFLFHICPLSTWNPHKSYDTLIVDTLKPGREPQQQRRKSFDKPFHVHCFLDNFFRPWLFNLFLVVFTQPPFRLRKRQRNRKFMSEILLIPGYYSQGCTIGA